MPQDSLPSNLPRLSRRSFIGAVGAVGAVMAVEPFYLATPAAAGRKSKPARWSDPKTWGGKVPGVTQVAIISKPVVLDADAEVAGVLITPKGRLIFDASRSITLRSSGNVEVRGRLVMRPSSPRRNHKLVFVNVNESRFVGGGMTVLPTDVGLWVMDCGSLNVVGASKKAWTRTVGGVSAGARSIRLKANPGGWRVGDEIAIVPTLGPGKKNHYAAYDYARVKRINGRTITLSKPTRFSHPRVRVSKRRSLTAEVLNLSRNVRIEGTYKGRSHIFIHSCRQQTIRQAVLRHMGPRHSDGKVTKAVLGRYGLHFHHAGHGAHGTVVRGVVVKNGGNHAFVPHRSHGVTFRECVSHDTYEDAFWYDRGERTNRILFDRCVASMVKTDPPFRGHRLTGFFLNSGSGNTARGCVAVGVQGATSTSGFHWPENGGGSWAFFDCVAHNNAVNGIFVWQNNPSTHDVNRFVSYRNGKAGIEHGAYENGYQYIDCLIADTRAVILHAAGKSNPRLAFKRCTFGGDIEMPKALGGQSSTPVLFADGRLAGKIRIDHADSQSGTSRDYDFVRMTKNGRDLKTRDFVISKLLPGTRVRVQRRTGSAFKVNANGSSEQIRRFA